jgi:hypothetical protein
MAYYLPSVIKGNNASTVRIIALSIGKICPLLSTFIVFDPDRCYSGRRLWHTIYPLSKRVTMHQQSGSKLYPLAKYVHFYQLLLYLTLTAAIPEGAYGIVFTPCPKG